MPELFRPTFKDHKTGKTRTSKVWYARIRGKRVPLKVTDRRIAERKAAEIERQLELGNDPALLDKASRQALSGHLLDFEESLRSKGCSAGHVGVVVSRLREALRRLPVRRPGRRQRRGRRIVAGAAAARGGRLGPNARISITPSRPSSSAAGWSPSGGP